MKIEVTKFLNSLSLALDYVEGEIIKTSVNHAKRVAILANKMGSFVGMDENVLFALTQAAALHDCALSEYLDDELAEIGYEPDELNMASHCIAGEEMCLKLPFYETVKGTVLYHHERANGTGALGKTSKEVPFTAQLVHMADVVDCHFVLYTLNQETYENLVQWVKEQTGSLFSKECANTFLNAIDYELLSTISGDGCNEVLKELIPDITMDIPTDILKKMSSLFSEITDYKSHFTWRHSLGIAEKAQVMGKFYGYSDELCDKLYIAGALHDIGKLLISNDILEKPGKLTTDEYHKIQNHAMGTWNLLHEIGGLEEITRWAALHHEKLDGSGYPFGLKADSLGKNERLLACVDIYQALVEERPYKAGLSHQEAIDILHKMGNEGQLDDGIINDIDKCFIATNVHSKKSAEPLESIHDKEAWKCPVCGYIYEGELPQDFICPRCEQPRSIFKKI